MNAAVHRAEEVVARANALIDAKPYAWIVSVNAVAVTMRVQKIVRLIRQLNREVTLLERRIDREERS